MTINRSRRQFLGTVAAGSVSFAAMIRRMRPLASGQQKVPLSDA